MIEPAIRSGVTYVYKNRRFIANNQYIPNYNSTEGHQFGGVMQLEKLPLSEFEFNKEITIQEVLDTHDNASVGYFVEVEISYPPGLQDDHQDFPLAPTKDIVEEEWLGEHQLSLKEQHNLTTSKMK